METYRQRNLRWSALASLAGFCVLACGSNGKPTSVDVGPSGASGGFTLTVDNTANWCTIEVTPPGGSLGNVASFMATFNGIAAGTVVTFAVTADPGYHTPPTWTGTDNDKSTSSTNTVTMTVSKTVTICCPDSFGGC